MTPINVTYAQTSAVLSSSSEKSFLQQARECIRISDFQRAIQFLTLAIQESSEIVELFDVLLALLPRYDGNQFKILIANLPHLFAASTHLLDEQAKLALKLAEWNIAYAQTHKQENVLPFYLDAMDYYAVAIKIAEKQGNRDLAHAIHLLASRLLIRVFCFDLIQKLDDNKGKPEVFGKLIALLGSLERFCCAEEDQQLVQELYHHAGSILANISFSSQPHYKAYLPLIKKGAHGFVLSKETITEVYSRHLKSWRLGFDELSQKEMNPQIVRNFQKMTSEKMREIFQVFLDDIVLVLGPPPCGYNLRALGSMGRSEPCPFSDLEFMILIEKEEHTSYFQKLAQLLEFQVVSLGETNTGTHPVFTCLGPKHTSGFHFDTGANPLSRPDLMGTPKKMAAFQLQPVNTNPVDVPTAPPNQVLKSARLLKNENSTLFSEYLEEMDKILDSGEQCLRHARALQLFETRSIDFKKAWPTPLLPNPINIKKQYVELLNFFLADMALYFGLQETNTLDIIEALVKKNVFTKNTGDLLKEAVASIYCIRVRLHQVYVEQKEEGYLNGLSPYQLTPKEVEQLKKIYWLVVRPIYYCLDVILKRKKSVEQVFRHLDLFSVVIDEVCACREDIEFFIPLVKWLTSHLICRPESEDSLFAIYRKISMRTQLEPLRQVFLTNVKNYIKQIEFERLARIPNPVGFRQSTRMAKEDLEKRLESALQPGSTPQYDDNGWSIKIEGVNLGGYIKKEWIKNIIDKDGNIRRNHKAASNVVNIQELGLHFKQQPHNDNTYSFYPGYEKAVSSLIMRLFGHGVSTSQLVIFTVKNHHHQKIRAPYMVLVSKSAGTNLIDKEIDVKSLDKYKLSNLFLSVPMIVPGDLHDANCVISDILDNAPNTKRELTFIDNDIAWVKPLTRNGNKFQVNLYFPLFIRFPNFVLDEASIKDFIDLDPALTLKDWLEELEIWNETHAKILKGFERLREGFSPYVLFNKNMGIQLLTQFYKVQAFLNENAGRPIKALEILKTLIQAEDDSFVHVGDVLYENYQQTLNRPQDPRDALKHLAGRKGEVSLSMTQSQAVMYRKLPQADAAKKLHMPRQAICEIEGLVSVNCKDFFLVQKRVSSCLELAGKKIDNDMQRSLFKGLNLHVFEKLSLSDCVALTATELERFIDRSGIKLRYLDLRGCIQITDASVRDIEKRCPVLEELYLSRNLKFENVCHEHLFGPSLPLHFPKLKVLHISHCEKLKVIRLNVPDLEIFKADHNDILKEVFIQSNFAPTINFNNCQQLVAPRFVNYGPGEVLGKQQPVSPVGYGEVSSAVGPSNTMHRQLQPRAAQVLSKDALQRIQVSGASPENDKDIATEIRSLEQSIDRYFKSVMVVSDLEQLNRLFKQLGQIAPQNFKNYVQKARKLLMEDPISELLKISSDEEFVSSARRILNRIDRVLEVFSFFGHEEKKKIAEMKQTVENRLVLIKGRLLVLAEQTHQEKLEASKIEILRNYETLLEEQTDYLKLKGYGSEVLRNYEPFQLELILSLPLNLSQPLECLEMLQQFFSPGNPEFFPLFPLKTFLTDLMNVVKRETNDSPQVTSEKRSLANEAQIRIALFFKSLVSTIKNFQEAKAMFGEALDVIEKSKEFPLDKVKSLKILIDSLTVVPVSFLRVKQSIRKVFVDGPFQQLMEMTFSSKWRETVERIFENIEMIRELPNCFTKMEIQEILTNRNKIVLEKELAELNLEVSHYQGRIDEALIHVWQSGAKAEVKWLPQEGEQLLNSLRACLGQVNSLKGLCHLLNELEQACLSQTARYYFRRKALKDLFQSFQWILESKLRSCTIEKEWALSSKVIQEEDANDHPLSLFESLKPEFFPIQPAAIAKTTTPVARISQTTAKPGALPLVPFGKAEWEKYIGKVEDEPPLPFNIE